MASMPSMKNKYQLLSLIFFVFVFVALVFRNVQLSHVPLQDWDESIYARVAYESAKGHHLSMTYNDKLWLEKPPLLVYLLSVSMMIFGQSEFWLRSISIVFGMAVLVCIYILGKKLAKDIRMFQSVCLQSQQISADIRPFFNWVRIRFRVRPSRFQNAMAITSMKEDLISVQMRVTGCFESDTIFCSHGIKMSTDLCCLMRNSNCDS
jgi:hypothetical protein